MTQAERCYLVYKRHIRVSDGYAKLMHERVSAQGVALGAGYSQLRSRSTRDHEIEEEGIMKIATMEDVVMMNHGATNLLASTIVPERAPRP